METLRTLRLQNKYTLKQVSELTGMSLKTVYRHERGESSVGFEQAAIYAGIYGITLDELYEGMEAESV